MVATARNMPAYQKIVGRLPASLQKLERTARKALRGRRKAPP
jgi:hypothetical protein